ncbi:MAG TPA: invasion associated locus B family protein [Rhizomicrobium sp.]|nr:invasion associated locus B family protein [Rhizomicrobium sp.]
MTNLTERLVIGVVALLVGLAVGWAVRGVVSYNTGTQAVTAYGSWRVACPAASQPNVNCELVQDVMDSQSHQEIVRIAVGKLPDGKSALDLVLPLGVALEPGVGLVMGTNPMHTAKYRTCTQQGCIVDIPLDQKLQKEFDEGKDGKVVFAGSNDNKPIAIPLSLTGYADAQRAYRRDEAKRASWYWRML